MSLKSFVHRRARVIETTRIVGFLSFSLLFAWAAPVATSPTGPIAATATATATQQATYRNPLLPTSFYDPQVIRVDGVYYAYASYGYGKNIQVARSYDLMNWQVLPDALPRLGAWATVKVAMIWAPEVIKIGDRLVMYYVAPDTESGRQCLGVATSARPEGPFVDSNPRALLCSPESDVWDPHPFHEGGKLYLYYSTRQSRVNYLFVDELTIDGTSLIGKPVRLLRTDVAWEGEIIEAPTMVKYEGKLYLFYSGNVYLTANYGVGYAICDSPAGPCVKAPENPILKSRLSSNPPVIAPGHQDVRQFGEQFWIFYHAWQVTPTGERGSIRQFYMDRLTWKEGKPVVLGPTTDPQPGP